MGTIEAILCLKRLSRDTDAEALQRILEAAPTYSMRISGALPLSTDAEAVFVALPPGVEFANKFVFGIYLKDKLIGFIDLIRGYPDARVAMLGLLILSEKFQAQGLGRRAYRLIEDVVRGWDGMSTIRIGVVESNAQVRSFWERCGFVSTGVSKPYENGNIRSQTIVLEKSLYP